MNSIFYGNGFNRLNNENSWESLVHVINDSKDIYRIPNTLQYEGKVLSEPYNIYLELRGKDGKLFKTADHKVLRVREESETLIKQNIVSQMKDYKSNVLFDRLLSLNANHYITTNYDNVADKVFEQLGYIEKKELRDKSENVFSIHRTRCYANNEDEKYLWKIHGELSNLSSIMLGYYHYCSYIGQIRKFLMGEYEYAKRKDLGIISRIEDRLRNGTFEVLSWIDAFLVSDIYIIGLGLYYDEIDLWWILTVRKRLIQKLGKQVVNNKILYYGNPEAGLASMFEHLDVKVITSKKKHFWNMYQGFIDDIEERINGSIQ